jgi:tRNA-splicing ligase RtcB (3'-phosphate/5'-hydroxy nucleic acid ligase)
MKELKKISEFIYKIPRSEDMNVDAIIYASEKLMDLIKEDKTIEQIKNVAKLPGIIKKSYAMPDAHQGYGFCIGGVAAFDLEKGIISPGGVGYDINCGVRLIRTDIKKEDFLKFREKISQKILNEIPNGVGGDNKNTITNEELKKYLTQGSVYAIEKGFGIEEDLQNCEEGGKIEGADFNNVSQRAIARGRKQLGTLGAGNHFIEIGFISEIYDKRKAKQMNISQGEITIMIHCGSRGLGHQVASDYIRLMEKEYGFTNLVDKELIHAPLNSELGKKYFSAMNASVNFAFANRQTIMHKIRKILEDFFPKNKNQLVYDVCHNIAKIEEHLIEGKKKKVCIHRKGATRSFENVPLIIPGSMGTASYLMTGTKEAEELSFGSSAHGAGRLMSRKKANYTIKPNEVKERLKDKNIKIYTHNNKGISEEAPEAYKDIDEVVIVSDSLGLAKKVAKIIPLSVIKG